MFKDSDSVLVIGVGRSGMATAEVLRSRGIAVVAYDDREASTLGDRVDSLKRIGVPLIGRAELDQAARAATAAVLSPGVPFTNAAVLAVQRLGVPVYAEIEVAYRICAAPIIAITGSKGKSTTTALVGHILRTAGIGARVGGNIGDPLIYEAAHATADEWVVAEVSSFQLEGIREFAPRISVLLNVTADHLDRYPSMEEYAEAKYRIFANQRPQDAFVGNADDEYCARLRAGARPIPSAQHWFSAAGDPTADMSLHDGAIVRRSGRSRRRSTLIAPHEMRLRGAHNVENAMAASLAALLAGAPASAVRAGLRSFAPLPHRLAPVESDDGINWVDDSKATNPDAVVKALESFLEPIVLIAGGRAKNTDFAALAGAASGRAKTVVLIGEAAKEIGAQLTGVDVVYARAMSEAVEAAAHAASPGDVVLLSPGCASFDMFDSAEHRGDVFATLVRNRRHGVVAS
ncbi:MAG TPA: UDP-N-acetylmuramoyl-L-alanine--D-glutamate ligase [Candidatus Eremiobacteraceae bacterium]|jgi:UDP-N-acetylmuramoylalanine--D-glutamate ligase